MPTQPILYPVFSSRYAASVIVRRYRTTRVVDRLNMTSTYHRSLEANISS
jgi:hypothetical protein